MSAGAGTGPVTDHEAGAGARARADAFRALHHGPRPLVLPNAWDAASARALADAGFPALATTSAGIAAALGHDDHQGAPAGEMFAAVARIARSVPVPVTADAEAGYGLGARELVERLLEAGAVGCNLEDTDHAAGAPGDPGRQAEWLARVREAAGGALVVNARVDTFTAGGAGTADDAIERGRRYLEAGADCVYPIFAPPELLPVLARALPGPLNAVCLPGGPSPARLAELGAARITFAAGFFRRADAAVRAMARELAGEPGSGG